MLRPLGITARRYITTHFFPTTTSFPLYLTSTPVQKHQATTTPSSSNQQIRAKHSNRQKKRLFTKNPARLRIARREARLRGEDTIEEPPLPTRRYPPIFEPEMLPNGWSAPPNEEDGFNMPNYPFSIERTNDKPNGAIGFLPVYSKFRHDGTKVTTLVRKVKGDQEAFLSEMVAVLGIRDREKQIRIRTGGIIEVNGNRVRDVKMWLAGLGF